MPKIRKADPTVRYYPPRLMERLEYIKSYTLTLIEAPSGFGKTTILEHFFEACIPQYVFCERYEFMPNRAKDGWIRFCDMLSRLDAVCGEKLMRLDYPDEDTLPDIEAALSEFRSTEEAYIWLDDYMNWDIPVPGEFLSALSEHAHGGLHIVVSTQPLSKEKRGGLFRNRNILRLREETFVFQLDDIDSYFRAAGIALTQEELMEAGHLSEGWIMALSIQLQNYITMGSFHQGGMEELMEDVFWEQLTPVEQTFLLRISIFPRFKLSQAAGVSGLGTEQTERLLTERRFFIHYDQGDRCFYMHTLLRRMLKKQFARLSESEQKKIYLLGGDLASQAGDRLNTLRFYYASGDWERIYAMPLTSYDIADITDENTRPMLLSLITDAPLSLKCAYPKALIPLSFALFFLGENEKLLSMKDEIENCITESPFTPKEKDALWGEMELLLSFLEYNRIEDMSKRHRRALMLLDGPARLISVKSTWTFGSPSVLYMFWRESGCLEDELRQMDECMPYYYKLTEGHGSGAEYIMRAEALFNQGVPDEAERLCHRALFAAELRRQNSVYQCGLFLLCRIAILRGNKEQLAEFRRALRDRALANTEDLCRYTADLAEGFISMLTDRLSDVPAWLSEGQIDQRRLVIMTQPFAYIIYGWCLLKRREFNKLLGVSEHFLGMSSIFPNLLTQVYTRLYMAQALDALGNRSEASKQITIALDIASPDGVYMPFAENCPGIRPLLPISEDRKEAVSEISRLSLLLEESRRESMTYLTPREKDILRYLRQDMSNKEIAEKLYLSPNTVRNTLSAMLKKYGLASREQLKDIREQV